MAERSRSPAGRGPSIQLVNEGETVWLGDMEGYANSQELLDAVAEWGPFAAMVAGTGKKRFGLVRFRTTAEALPFLDAFPASCTARTGLNVGAPGVALRREEGLLSAGSRGLSLAPATIQ